MKLVFVGNDSWSMWNFRREVLLNFQSQGHQVVVAAPADGHVELIKNHFEYEQIHWLARKGRNPFRDLLLTLEFLRVYRKHKPDYIFQYTIKPNIYGSIAAFFYGKRPFCVVAGMGHVFTHRSALTILVMFLYRIATSIAEKVIFLNCDDIADFKRFHMLPKNSEKAMLLPSEGVDIEFYSRQNFGAIVEDTISKNEQNKRSQIVLIFVGRLLIDKGIREYLQAARKIRKKYPFARFQVLGPIDDGNPSTIKPHELNSFIESGEIEYLGSVSDVRPYISNADALVLPTSYGEGFSRVCLEALSMGVPVISSDNRGCRNAVIHYQTGLTFPSSRMHLLPDVIEEFINLPNEKRRDMGVNGQKLVTERYTTKHVQQHYVTLVPEEAN